MSETGRRAWRLATSPKLAASLIVALIVMSVLSVVVPQSTYLPQQAITDFRSSLPDIARIAAATGLDAIFSGWLIATLASALVLNLFACTLDRALRRRRPVRIPSKPGPSDSTADASPWAGDARSLLDSAAEWLEEEGWAVRAVSDQGMVASRGTLGFWGSVFLHAGLVTVIAGAAAGALGGFAGEMLLAEGQTVLDAREHYLRVDRTPRVGAAFSGSRITLESMEVRYEGGMESDVVANMAALEPSGRMRTWPARVNYPFEVAGKSFLLQDSGLAPELLLSTAEGTRQVVVNLADKTAAGWSDSYELADGQRLDMTATPVPLAPGQDLPGEKLLLKDPRLQVAVVSTAGTVWSGQLGRGQSSPSIGPGMKVKLEGMSLWTRFLVRGAPYRWLLYLGFALGIAGAAARFAVAERRLAVLLSRDGRTGLTMSVRLRSRPWKGFEASADDATVRRLLEMAAEGPD